MFVALGATPQSGASIPVRRRKTLAPFPRRALEALPEAAREMREVGEPPVERDRSDGLSGHRRISQVAGRPIETALDDITRERVASALEQLVNVAFADADGRSNHGNREVRPAQSVVDGTTHRKHRGFG